MTAAVNMAPYCFVNESAVKRFSSNTAQVKMNDS